MRYYGKHGLVGRPFNLEDKMANPEIKRAFRGVDTSQVDEAIRAITHRLSTIQTSIGERNRSIQRLKTEISDPSVSTPSFSKLGSAFEETLRSAEEHARQLRQSAAFEAAEITNKTDIDIQNLTEKTDRETRDIVAAAEAEANETRLQVERETIASKQQIADERARIETLAARADRTGSSMISQAEQQLSDVRAAAHREVEELKRQAAEIIRIASNNKVDVETRIGIEVSDAQARSTAIHDETDSAARSAYETADAHVENAIVQAESLKQDADDYLRSAQIRADEILQDSRGLVQKSISEAMSRSEEITRSSEEFFADFVFDAENSINEARRNKLALTDYALHIRGVSNGANFDAIEGSTNVGLRRIEQAEIVDGDN